MIAQGVQGSCDTNNTSPGQEAMEDGMSALSFSRHSLFNACLHPGQAVDGTEKLLQQSAHVPFLSDDGGSLRKYEVQAVCIIQTTRAVSLTSEIV